jgi:hypothetical protein
MWKFRWQAARATIHKQAFGAAPRTQALGWLATVVIVRAAEES